MLKMGFDVFAGRRRDRRLHLVRILMIGIVLIKLMGEDLLESIAARLESFRGWLRLERAGIRL